MRISPLFLGLTKPTKVFGLPIEYFLLLAFSAVLPFILLDDMRFLIIFLVGYPVLWLVGDRHPKLFSMLRVTFSRTPRTATFKINGGNDYVS